MQPRPLAYADIPDGGSVAVLGLGPIGDMSCRIARHLGAQKIIAVDLVPERLARARQTASRCSTWRRPTTSSQRCVS